MKEEIKTREFEVRSQKRKNSKDEEFLAYQVKTKLGWISLFFPKEKLEQFSDEIKTILQKKNFKIIVPDSDETWNIKNRNGFDVMYVSEILSAEELNYPSRKEKYFGD